MLGLNTKNNLVNVMLASVVLALISYVITKFLLNKNDEEAFGAALFVVIGAVAGNVLSGVLANVLNK